MTELIKRDFNSVPVLAILNTNTGQVEMVHGEDGLAQPLLGIMNYTWDTDSMLPVKMTQQAFNVDTVEALMDGSYFKDNQYEYDVDNNCIYKGSHITLNALDSDTGWNIIRYDYTDDNVTRKRYRVTSWTNRATGW